MNKIILSYNLLLTTTVMVAGLVAAQTGNDRVFALLFLPMVLFFARRLFIKTPTPALLAAQGLLPYSEHNDLITMNSANYPTAGNSGNYPLIDPESGQVIDPEVLTESQVDDVNRRLFLKLIGTAGLATFTFSLFTKKTHAAFFGSIPGPGTVALKDSQGNKIDPAEKQPTDGYEVTEIDDSATPSYYGFVHKDGAWYITREDATGGFRYANGSSNFSNSWSNRASLTYDYFDAVFN